MSDNVFSKKLKRIRAINNTGKTLSQVKMAKLLGVNLATYRHWEWGYNYPRIENEIMVEEKLKKLEVEE